MPHRFAHNVEVGVGAMSVVAVVDDDADMRAMMVATLQTWGYDVCEASDGAAALDVIRMCAPDLVVLDWMMPGKSGIDVCRDIRADAALASVPVLMVTSRSTRADRDASLAAGATSILTKPFTLRDFLVAVQGLLEAGGTMSPVWLSSSPPRSNYRRLNRHVR
jgi:DNA-binding response OmpR family regulator